LRILNWIALVGQNIRLSLFVNLSIFATLYYLASSKLKKGISVFMVFGLIWLVVFLYLLNSLTGHITFAFLILFSSFFIFRKNKKLVLILASSILVTGVTFSAYIANLVNEFYKVEAIDFDKLEDKTRNGNLYYHDIKSKRIENGHYVIKIIRFISI
jgi:cell division protein FtsW (lipid II flippase)